ncbi:MAG: MgtC/SapB family protein [Thermoplasmatota archaeon]
MVVALSTDFLLDFLTTLGIGALIGLEREHRSDEAIVIAGVRTFPLFSLAGYMVGLIAATTAQPLISAAGVLLAAAIAIAFLYVRVRLGTHGLTTPMAIIVTFLLGVIIAYGYREQAVVIGVATTFLLLTKTRLHAFAGTLDDEEFLSALQFITIVFILFPIAQSLQSPVLGYAWIGRGQLVDPYEILLIAVFVSTLSFASFLAMRFVGPSLGIEVAGLLGGLVNSEATSVSLATRAKESPTLAPIAAVGILAAVATSFIRSLLILIFSSGTRWQPITQIFLPVAAAGMIAAGAIAVYLRKEFPAEMEIPQPTIRNPFAIMQALWFALLFGVLSAGVTLLSQFGTFGVYIAALGGFVNAGAVVASIGALFLAGKVDVHTAAITCSLSVIAQAANKYIILRPANLEMLRRLKWPLFIVLACSAVALAAVVAIPGL